MSPWPWKDILSQVAAPEIAPATAWKKRGFSTLLGGLCEIAAIRSAPTGPKPEHAGASNRRRGASPPLLDVRENTVELVEAVVAHDQLALAAGGMLDGDLRTELVGEFLLEALDVRVAAVLTFRG